MSAAHTPGPWAWDANGNTLRAANPDPATSHVHTILDAYGGSGFLCSDRDSTKAELDANWRLIAAAPELLQWMADVMADSGTVLRPALIDRVIDLRAKVDGSAS